ncbi:unnamed protein product, partial [Prorocentrum cordatum]
EVEEEEEREEEEAAGQMEEEEEEGEQQEEEKEVRRGHPRGRALFLPAVSCLGRAGGRRPGVPQGPRPAAEPPGAGCPAREDPGRPGSLAPRKKKNSRRKVCRNVSGPAARRAGPERGGRARPRGRAAVPRLAFAARWADAQEKAPPLPRRPAARTRHRVGGCLSPTDGVVGASAAATLALQRANKQPP